MDLTHGAQYGENWMILSQAFVDELQAMLVNYLKKTPTEGAPPLPEE